MKLLRMCLFPVLACAASAQPAPTIASAVDREISGAEKQITEIAEAMPESRYDFSPESLNIAGAEYKGVRTFAQQVKHVAASNYAIWSGVTGDHFPNDFMGGNGPENVKSKAEILKFLGDSFALGHKAAGTLTAQNMLENPGKSKSTRLRIVVFGTEHAFDHYGQMVEYLRMKRYRAACEPWELGMTYDPAHCVGVDCNVRDSGNECLRSR